MKNPCLSTATRSWQIICQGHVDPALFKIEIFRTRLYNRQKTFLYGFVTYQYNITEYLFPATAWRQE
jgi:hypothetical protein